jgi:hypothetical protein
MESIETKTATVERHGEGLVVCRYKLGVPVDAFAVRENMEVRLRFKPVPKAVVSVFPDGLEIDSSLLQRDHYAQRSLSDAIDLLAIVLGSSLQVPIAELYLSYHPTRFSSRIFTDEAEAMAWITAEMAKLKQARP